MRLAPVRVFSCKYPLREFKHRCFWATHVNRKWAFSSFNTVCLGATKFVLLSVFTLIESTCPRICSKSRPKSLKKVNFRLTCVRRSKTSRLKLRSRRQTGKGKGRQKGEGIGERRNFFFFPTPLSFLRMPRRFRRDTWGCLLFSDKNSRPAFFSFWSHAPLQWSWCDYVI